MGLRPKYRHQEFQNDLATVRAIVIDSHITPGGAPSDEMDFLVMPIISLLRNGGTADQLFSLIYEKTKDQAESVKISRRVLEWWNSLANRPDTANRNGT